METPKPDYWDLLVYISPEKLQSMPSDCGDSYDDKDRHHGFSTLRGMKMMMKEHGPPFTNQNYSSFGSDKTMKTMEDMMEHGVSILINPMGEMRIIPGDAINERKH